MTLKVSGWPSGSEALGVKLQVALDCTLVVGVPEISGG
jgi:hypothetical protein